MTFEIKDKLKELANNLMESLCCGSDLPKNNYTLDEIYSVIKDAYDISFNSVVWHKFPDELPEGAQDVLTVAIDSESKRLFYHTFSFMGKKYVEDLLKEHRNPSTAFLQWVYARNYDVVAWCELPKYEVSNV